jgi:hypothetical protein
MSPASGDDVGNEVGSFVVAAIAAVAVLTTSAWGEARTARIASNEAANTPDTSKTAMR